MSLQNGALLLVVDHGDGNTDRFRVRGRGRLDDNEWHTATIIRDGRRVTLDVDGQRFDQVLTNDANMIGYGALTLGGSDDVRDLTDSHVRSRLTGEIMEVCICYFYCTNCYINPRDHCNSCPLVDVTQY